MLFFIDRGALLRRTLFVNQRNITTLNDDKKKLFKICSYISNISYTTTSQYGKCSIFPGLAISSGFIFRVLVHPFVCVGCWLAGSIHETPISALMVDIYADSSKLSDQFRTFQGGPPLTQILQNPLCIAANVKQFCTMLRSRRSCWSCWVLIRTEPYVLIGEHFVKVLASQLKKLVHLIFF